MVKLSRPSSFGRKQSAGTGSNGKSGWTKPVEFNRSSSSKRWSFRKTESAGGESEFTLTRDTSKSKSKSKSETNDFTRTGSSFHRVASAADSLLATGTLEQYDSEEDLTVSRTRSGGSGYKLGKTFSLTSRKDSVDDRNDDDGNDMLGWANPFSGIFNDEDTAEFRDADDDYSQFTHDSATVGTEQTGATDTRPQKGASSLNGGARDGSFFDVFARSVSNHLNPDHSGVGEGNEEEEDDDDSRYNLEARSSGRESSYYSTDEEEGASSWDEDEDGDDDNTRRTNPHSFDAGEELETEAGASGGNAAADGSKSKLDAEDIYLYQFSTRVRIDDDADDTDGPAKKSTEAKETKEAQEASNPPSVEGTKTKKSRGRSLKKMVPKFRSTKKSKKSDAKKTGADATGAAAATIAIAATAKTTTTSASSRPKGIKNAIKAKSNARVDKKTENEAALRDMMESARHVAAEESRETILVTTDDDDAQSLEQYSQYSHAPTVASNKTNSTARSSRSLASMSAKISERKESSRIKKEIRNRDKAREVTLRRIDAEEQKRLKAEKREAEIAAANAKEVEARAKLAAIIAESRLKKQQDEFATKRRSNAKEKEVEPEEEKTGTVNTRGTTSSNEEDLGGPIPLGSRKYSIEEGVLRAADVVDLFLATGKLGASSAPRSSNKQETEEPVSPPRRSRRQSRPPSPSDSKKIESDDCGETKTTKSKSFARQRSMPRARSLSRPTLFRKKQEKKQLEEDDESTTVEDEPVDVTVFKKKEEIEQFEDEDVEQKQPSDVDMDYTFSEEASEGYSEDSSDMSEDLPMDESPPPPPRRSAVSELLSQPPVPPLLPPLPASPQHSVSSRSMATYDPTALSSPRSIGSEQYGNTSFARSSTYRPGDITTSTDLRPSALRRQPSPKRSVSFQRMDAARNDVIVEEEIEDVLEQSMNDMALQTNIKLSPRAAGSKNTFCIHEYDDEGHQAVVYNEFSSTPIRSLKIYQYDGPPRIKRSSSDVLVKIQASTVSYSDCIIRQGKWWGSDSVTPPITPGVDFVGKICSVGDEAADMYDYRPGDTVASLVRCGGNARYAVIDAAKLVDVPSEVEPTSAVCMLETYLAAFQSLHLGEDEDTRYEKTSMLGKNVLIIGGIAMVGQAMIELAFLAGASAVYVTAREKHHDFLRSLGTIPLSMKVEEWLPSVKGRMDLIVDAYCTNHYSETADALDPNGKMVCIRTKSSMLENDPGLLWQAEAFLTKMGISPLSQTFTYDVYESWDENIDLCKDDMAHLFDLLRKGLVEPPIADCLPLTKVPQAQKLFETKRIQGFFVCEPWLKKKQKAGFC